MKNQEHSPLPWDASENDGWIYDKHGLAVGNTYSKINAQFIVTACNYHERMKDILQKFYNNGLYKGCGPEVGKLLRELDNPELMKEEK